MLIRESLRVPFYQYEQYNPAIANNAVLSGATTCVISCKAGEISVDDECVPCPAGTKEEDGKCVECPVGHYSANPGKLGFSVTFYHPKIMRET